MCSISGIIEISCDRSDNSLDKIVERMNEALRHRGPDDEGLATFRKDLNQSSINVCLGNTRLSIIDTSSAGHQPMVDPETGNCLTYNGESYNFLEIRKEIGDEFGPWRSGTDTEVVLRAYRKWGIEAFRRLRGMFALALWDANSSELILARDPLGIKPLYYTFASTEHEFAPAHGHRYEARKLLFASELRALLATGKIARTLDQVGVNSYLTYGSVQAPRTVIEGVWSLMPGQCLRVTCPSGVDLDLALSQFDSIEPESGLNGSGNHQTRSESIHELRHELMRSLESHLVSDVPLGVFLSGGMDSSALVALMSQLGTGQPKTFSVVFDEQEFSEAAHANLVAHKFRTEHREVRLSENSLLEMLPDALTSLDQPSIDAMNTYVISQAVKEAGISVALSGLGGDELFAGYPSFRRAARSQSLKHVPGPLRSSLAVATKLNGNQFARQNKFWQVASSRGTPQEIYSISRQLFSPNQIASISKLDVEPGMSNSNGRNGDVVNTMSRLELQGYMANTLLRDTDCMSMAHSLEVRVPFVDKRVVRKVLSLPGKWKLNSRSKVPKPLLAETMHDLLPADFLSRPKMGFTLPFEKWMLSKLRDDILRVLADDKLIEASYLRTTGVTRLFESFQAAPRSVGWSRPWSTYVLARWCEINQVAR